MATNEGEWQDVGNGQYVQTVTTSATSGSMAVGHVAFDNCTADHWVNYPYQSPAMNDNGYTKSKFYERVKESNKNKLPEGVEMKSLYDVYMIYAEDRKKPEVLKEEGVIANNEEDAKIKSGLMKEIDENWDADYLTFICNEIGEVKVKEKPKEVKNV